MLVNPVNSRLDVAARRTYQLAEDCSGINYWFSCMLIGINNSRDQEGKAYHGYKGKRCLRYPDCKESLDLWMWPLVYTGHFLCSSVHLNPEPGSTGASLNLLPLK